MNDKSIELLESIVEKAISHGGDSGGPYYSNAEELLVSLNNFLLYHRIDDYHAIKIGYNVYIEKKFLYTAKIDHFKDISDNEYLVDEEKELKDFLIKSIPKKEILYNFNNLMIHHNKENYLVKSINCMRMCDRLFILGKDYLYITLENLNKIHMNEKFFKRYENNLCIKLE